MARFLVSRILARTPKRTGATVTHWVATTTKSSARRHRKNRVVSSSRQKIESVIKRLTGRSGFYLSINDLHITHIENGSFEPTNPGPSKDPYISKFTGRRRGKIWVSGGFSTQAPMGIVGPSLKELKIRYGGKFKFVYMDATLISAFTGERVTKYF